MNSALLPQLSFAVRQLVKLGLIPENCTRFELILDSKQPIRAKCEFLVTEEQMQQIAGALKDHPGEVEKIIKQIHVGASYSVTRPEMERLPDLDFEI